MNERTCYACDKTETQLLEWGIHLRDDGNCEKCHRKLMQEWKKEKRELEKYWEDTRL